MTVFVQLLVAGLTLGLVYAVIALGFQYVSPVAFGLNTTILVVSMVIVGGMGDMTGALVGALVLSLLPQWLRGYVGLEPVIYGGVLVLMLTLLPEGVVPALRRALRRPRRTPAAASAADEATA